MVAVIPTRRFVAFLPTLRELGRTAPFFILISLLVQYFVHPKQLKQDAAPRGKYKVHDSAPCTMEDFPLQVFPLLKELKGGWGNMQIPPLLMRNASGTRTLIVDIGLDEGVEFFYAIDRGFEVVGIEPNPVSFQKLSERCAKMPDKCAVANEEVLIKKQSVTSFRKPGMSYLINAGAGAAPGELELALRGAAGTFVKMDIPFTSDSPKAKIPIIRVDDIIQEDVFLLKVDTQGFEHFVFQGSQSLLTKHTVRQIVFEMEPFAMSKSGHQSKDTLALLQSKGVICFPHMTGNRGCDYFGDTAKGFDAHYFANDNIVKNVGKGWANCWDDLVCVNIMKSYTGTIPRFL